MMISLIVVALVGIGFTRLTMLALELRDNFDDVAGDEPIDMGRKRVDAHNKMRQMPKPEVLVFKNDNQFEVSGRGVADAETYAVAVSEKLSAGFSSLFASSSGSAPPGDADLEKGVAKDADGSATEKLILETDDDADDTDSLLDPTDACTICFEKAKNAVILDCGHGGCCYNCSIDVCVTSGMCPFCRKDINQIVTIGLGKMTVDMKGRKVIPVIGPK